MADIFISYSHADRIKVLRLVRALEAQGWTVWWDRESISGTLWNETVLRELKSAQCAIVAWSEASICSDFVKDEAGLALAQDKLLPITLDQTAPPHQFRSIETLDLSRWLGSADDPNFVLLQRGIQRTTKNKDGEVRPAKIDKNKTALKIWGITIGGTFYGFASGVIAKPLAAVAVAIAVVAASIAGYVVVSRSPTSNDGISEITPASEFPVGHSGAADVLDRAGRH